MGVRASSCGSFARQLTPEIQSALSDELNDRHSLRTDGEWHCAMVGWIGSFNMACGTSIIEGRKASISARSVAKNIFETRSRGGMTKNGWQSHKTTPLYTRLKAAV